MSLSGRVLALTAAVSCAISLRLNAAEWHVAPTGTKDGTGSATQPWDLASACNAPAAVQPGDTIWLHGGTYKDTCYSRLKGTAARPIILRQAPREHAIIDGGDSQGLGIVLSQGAYTWFWGFEVMSSDPMRRTEMPASWPADLKRGEGIGGGNDETNCGVGTKYINIAVHDTRQGVSLWRNAGDYEVYGCIIYYNGWDAPDRGHGHAIYAQGGETSKPTLAENIMFRQYSHGIHVYGSAKAWLDNFTLVGNVAFDNGVISHQSGFAGDYLLGGGRTAKNPVITENFGYHTPGLKDGLAVDFGYGHGCTNPTIKDNYFAAAGAGAFHLLCEGPAGIEGNTFYGAITGEAVTTAPDGTRTSTPVDIKATYPNNTYLDAKARPQGLHVFVRPNKYEAGRAHIVVYNWENADSITADVSKALQPGDAYEVVDAQNYFGAPVAQGVYDGKPIILPMNLTTVAQVVGTPVADFAHTPKEFGVFVLTKVLAK